MGQQGASHTTRFLFGVSLLQHLLTIGSTFSRKDKYFTRLQINPFSTRLTFLTETGHMKTLLAAISLLLLPAYCMAQSYPGSPAYLIQDFLNSTAFTVISTVFMLVALALAMAKKSPAPILVTCGMLFALRVMVPFMAEMNGQNLQYSAAPSQTVTSDEEAAPETTVIAVSEEGRPSLVNPRRTAQVVTPVPTIQVMTFALPEEKLVAPDKSPSTVTIILSVLGVMAAAAAVLGGGAFAMSRVKARTLYATKSPKPVNTGYTPQSSKRVGTLTPGAQSGFTPASPRT